MFDNAALTTIILGNPDQPQILRYKLDILAAIGGTITTGVSGDYEAAEMINLEAKPNDNYEFANWTSSNGGIFSDANNQSTKFTMPKNATVVTANFKEIIHSTSTIGYIAPREPDASQAPQTDAYKLIIVKNIAGNDIVTFDTTKFEIVDNAITLKTIKESESFVYQINLERLNELRIANKNGKFCLINNDIQYLLPFDMTNKIVGLADYIKKNKLIEK